MFWSLLVIWNHRILYLIIDVMIIAHANKPYELQSAYTGSGSSTLFQTLSHCKLSKLFWSEKMSPCRLLVLQSSFWWLMITIRIRTQATLTKSFISETVWPLWFKCAMEHRNKHMCLVVLFTTRIRTFSYLWHREDGLSIFITYDPQSSPCNK